MPGIVVFRRRWSVGSDDLVVPGAFLFTIHLVWTIVLAVLLGVAEWDSSECVLRLQLYVIGYLIILALSLVIELSICAVALRGSILDTAARAPMQYILYTRLVVLISEIAWLVVGVLWIVKYYRECAIERPKEVVLGLVICGWCVVLSVLMTVWCTYDTAGRSWVKMKKYQRSMREAESRFQYRRSGSTSRNWRQRKVIRAYQDSWDARCRLLFCCMRPSDRNRNSFADIAKLLSDFFRDLDVVPSDVVAGLVLLRKFQKIEREAIIRERKNDTYEYLSGVAVTPRTQFLKLHDPRDMELFQTVIHYMNYAMAAYGWPIYLMTYSATGLCYLCAKMRCTCVPCHRAVKETTMIVEDNCCRCNYTALKRIIGVGEVEVTYATFHVDVGETPFFVAVDFIRRKVVLCIRGTLSMKDVLTDLNADSEPLPVNPPRDDWLGHKGMVQAAVYIRDKLAEERLLESAFELDPAGRGTDTFGLVLVGHSLGAGTASILAILLREQYPDLKCFSYAPPGGLISMPAVEYSKKFIISVVVGKDVVPRIGLHQMEALRADLINAIKRSVDPKWKTIACSALCCGCASMPTSAETLRSDNARIDAYQADKGEARMNAVHPSDSNIALTLHRPLYPPGRIIHVVRHHPTSAEQALSKKEPVYQAVWADNTDFDEVLISPVMIQDHMPDKMLEALGKVVTTFGPRKPQRTSSSITSADFYDSEQCHLLNSTNPTIEQNIASPSRMSPTSKQRLCLETSFTSLQSPTNDIFHPANSSVNSSQTGSYYPSKISPIQLSSILYPDAHNDGGSPSWHLNTLTSPQSLNWQFLTNSSSVSPILPPKSPQSSLKELKTPSNNDTFRKCSVTNEMMQHNIPKTSRIFTSSHSMSYVESRQNPPKLSRPKNFSFEFGTKVDLIHDDWFGLAPLASPESLSEVSSISSRASYAFREPKTNLTEVISTSYELRTPTVMRRTPKISGNLSTCADDIKNVRYYQKLRNSKLLKCPSLTGSSHTGSSENLSYESATSIDRTVVDNYESKLVDCHSIENKILETIQMYNFINTSTETDSFQSVENILDDDKPNEYNCTNECPNCSCRFNTDNNVVKISDKITNSSIAGSRCCKKYDHTDCLLPLNNNNDDPDLSITPTIEIKNFKTEMFYPKETLISNIIPTYLETHFDQSFFESDKEKEEITPSTSAQEFKIPLLSETMYEDDDKSKTNVINVSVFDQYYKTSALNQNQTQQKEQQNVTYTSHILSPTSPEIDQDLISNFAIDLNLDPENRAMPQYASPPIGGEMKSSPSIDSGSICKTPSESKSVSFCPQIISIDPNMIQKGFHNESTLTVDLKSIMKDSSSSERSISPYYKNMYSSVKEAHVDYKLPEEKKSNKKQDKWYLLPRRSPKKFKGGDNNKDSSKPLLTKIQTIEDQCFAKNESLPLLTGLSSTAERTSPSYVRRKKYVYPITKVGKGESSV